MKKWTIFTNYNCIKYLTITQSKLSLSNFRSANLNLACNQMQFRNHRLRDSLSVLWRSDCLDYWKNFFIATTRLICDLFSNKFMKFLALLGHSTIQGKYKWGEYAVLSIHNSIVILSLFFLFHILWRSF